MKRDQCFTNMMNMLARVYQVRVGCDGCAGLRVTPNGFKDN